MKKTIIIISILTLFEVLSCTPVDRPDEMVPPEIPGRSGGENGVENYTPEISTDENGYDGLTATDKESDTVISGDVTYWENQDFSTTVTVEYSGNTATVTSTGNELEHYITGADVALDLTDAGAAEIIASGKSDDG